MLYDAVAHELLVEFLPPTALYIHARGIIGSIQNLCRHLVSKNCNISLNEISEPSISSQIAGAISFAVLPFMIVSKNNCLQLL